MTRSVPLTALAALVATACVAERFERVDVSPPPLAPAPAPPPPCYHLVAKHSGLVLAIREARADEGADAIQWTDSGGDEQRFELVPASHGTVRLRAVHSGKYLAVSGGRTDQAAPIVQTGDAAAPSAQWTLLPVGGDWFHVVALHSEQCLAISAREMVPGSLAIQWPCFDGDEQSWRFVLSPRAR